MKRNAPYDSLAKAVLHGVLSRQGAAKVQFEISPNARWTDLYFRPDPEAKPATGLLGRVARTPLLLEACHRPPSVTELRGYRTKQLLLHELERRELRPKPAEPPDLWIFAAGRPRSAIRAYGLQPRPGWPRGVYTGPPIMRTHLVVVSELERSRETLLTRLMGARRTLAEAVADLRGLPAAAWERRALAKAVGMLHFLKDQLGERVAMEVQRTYAEWRDQAVREGIEQGIEQGIGRGVARGARKVLLRLLDLRFGPLPVEAIARVREATSDQIEAWAIRVLDASTLAEVLED